nr:PREDICTED: protein enabled isoform X4 [Bemisia tabaci]
MSSSCSPADQLQAAAQDGRKSELSIASARASVMLYDDVSKKWIPSGTSSGVSKVHIFQHQVNNTFRVVGRKLKDHEVVINCVILKSLKYNQATATFHQWRDNKQVYGLNFSNKEDADAFARAMMYAVEVLGSASNRPARVDPGPPPTYEQAVSQYDEDMGYRTMTREDVAIIQERRVSSQSQISSPSTASSPGGLNNVGVSGTQASPVPPQVPGHHRTSSAPPAPQPPPMSLATPSVAPVAPPCPPPCPPLPPQPISTSVEPEASMSRSNSSDNQDPGSLAAQLQSARLRRANKQSAENSGSSTSSNGSAGNYGTLRGTTGMASMLDEMTRTLARRRAAVEKTQTDVVQDGDGVSGDAKKSWNSPNSKSGCESPKPVRKQLANSSEELVGCGKVNGSVSELESLKQEILKEMKKEISRMKQDIIDAIKIELNRR